MWTVILDIKQYFDLAKELPFSIMEKVLFMQEILPIIFRKDDKKSQKNLNSTFFRQLNQQFNKRLKSNESSQAC